ncbi:MAG: gliding motility-associated C-terminal domain-containing protein [Cytophagaceae bacterium]|nr:MAG: gliding motility-associated C-terminal domain-containing protein [Cytophagaceae bacterium]
MTVTPPTRTVTAGQTTTFTASSTTPNAIFDWYTTPTGGTSIFTGATFTTPPINATVVYYAEAKDPATNQVSTTRATGTITLAIPTTPPTVAVNPPTRQIISGQTTTFTATSTTPGAIFTWYTTPTGGTAIFAGATFTTPPVTTETTFYAEARDPVSGLVSVTRATGLVTLIDAGLFIPNAFTPNGDGNNDVLLIYGTNIKDANVSVYDQWGELQFRSTNKSSGWDGTYKGRAQPAGVYVYYAEITLNNGQVIKKRGTITLLR